MSGLPEGRGASEPSASRGDEPVPEPPRRAATPLVCCIGISSDGTRGRYPVVVDHRTGRKDGCQRPGGVGGFLGKVSDRPAAPSGRGAKVPRKKDPQAIATLERLV